MTLGGDSEVEIRRLLHIFFKDSPEKVEYWLNHKNLNFGGISPKRLIELGRGHKVLAFIKEAEQSWIIKPPKLGD